MSLILFDYKSLPLYFCCSGLTKLVADLDTVLMDTLLKYTLWIWEINSGKHKKGRK